MSSASLRWLASEESWSLTIVMTEKLSDWTVIASSSISTIRNVRVKHDRNVYVNVAAALSPTTLGTFGKQLEIHYSPSCCEKRPLTTILDSGNISIAASSSAGILSCKFSGFKGTSIRAHRQGSLLPGAFFSMTKALRLPCWPSAVLNFNCTFVTPSEFTFRVVSKAFWEAFSSFMLFSLQILPSMLSKSTAWLL